MKKNGENLCELYMGQRINIQDIERTQKSESKKQMTQFKNGLGICAGQFYVKVDSLQTGSKTSGLEYTGILPGH